MMRCAVLAPGAFAGAIGVVFWTSDVNCRGLGETHVPFHYFQTKHYLSAPGGSPGVTSSAREST